MSMKNIPICQLYNYEVYKTPETNMGTYIQEEE